MSTKVGNGFPRTGGLVYPSDVLGSMAENNQAYWFQQDQEDVAGGGLQEAAQAGAGQAQQDIAASRMQQAAANEPVGGESVVDAHGRPQQTEPQVRQVLQSTGLQRQPQVQQMQQPATGGEHVIDAHGRPQQQVPQGQQEDMAAEAGNGRLMMVDGKPKIAGSYGYYRNSNLAADAGKEAAANEAVKSAYDDLDEDEKAALKEAGVDVEKIKGSYMNYDPEKDGPFNLWLYESMVKKPEIDEKKMKRAKVWSAVADIAMLLSRTAGAFAGANISPAKWEESASGRLEANQRRERDKYDEALKQYREGQRAAAEKDYNMRYESFKDQRKLIHALLVEGAKTDSKKEVEHAKTDEVNTREDHRQENRLELKQKDIEAKEKNIAELHRQRIELKELDQKGRLNLAQAKSLLSIDEVIEKAELDLKELREKAALDVQKMEKKAELDVQAYKDKYEYNLGKTGKSSAKKGASPISGVDRETYDEFKADGFSDEQIKKIASGQDPGEPAEKPEDGKAAAASSGGKAADTVTTATTTDDTAAKADTVTTTAKTGATTAEPTAKADTATTTGAATDSGVRKTGYYLPDQTKQQIRKDGMTEGEISAIEQAVRAATDEDAAQKAFDEGAMRARKRIDEGVRKENERIEAARHKNPDMPTGFLENLGFEVSD